MRTSDIWNSVKDYQKRGNRKMTYNKCFASGGVTLKLGSLCFYSFTVLVNSFELPIPSELKGPPLPHYP